MITTLLWGVWGALIEIPEKAGFPATLGYSVWALTMIPVAVVGLKFISWKLDFDKQSVFLGVFTGLMGCGGQLILFQCLRMGPAYIVFPIISLYPVMTIFLSVTMLKEKASRRAWIGISLALIAIVMLAYQSPGNSSGQGYMWLFMAISVFFLWGLQAFVMKFGGDSAKPHSMQAESFAFYTMMVAVLLIPVAMFMTDFSQDINWGVSGLHAAALIQLLNSVGYLFFAYTLRYGKAIIAVPMMSLAPVVTVILSLILYAVIPHFIIIVGTVLAFIAIYLMAE